MLHNVVVTNMSGHLLLAKYFDKTAVEARKDWERQLFRQTCMNWGDVESGYQVAAVGCVPYFPVFFYHLRFFQ